MKEFTMILWFLLMLSLFFGCAFVNEQAYYCDAGLVDRVRIVRLDTYVKDELRFEYTVLAEVEEPAPFVEQLNSITQSQPIFGDPSVMEPGFVVIRIDYRDGNCDLIYNCTQVLYRPEGNQTPCFCFSREAFDDLVNSTLDNH